MKKIILASLGFLLTLSAGAQISATNRMPGDGTGRSLNWFYIPKSPTGGTDTVFISSGAYSTIAGPDSIKGTARYCVKTASANYVGDELTFICNTSKLKTHDTLEIRNKYNNIFRWIKGSDSTINVVGGKRIYAEFIFDGTYWNETVMDTIAN